MKSISFAFFVISILFMACSKDRDSPGYSWKLTPEIPTPTPTSQPNETPIEILGHLRTTHGSGLGAVTVIAHQTATPDLSLETVTNDEGRFSLKPDFEGPYELTYKFTHCDLEGLLTPNQMHLENPIQTKPADFGVKLKNRHIETPERFTNDLQLVAKTKPSNAELAFFGSSSFRFWRHAQSNFSPISVVNLGIAGITIDVALVYAMELLQGTQANRLLFYLGDNDSVLSTFTMESFLANYERILCLSESMNPDAKLYLLAIKPSPKRANVWSKVQLMNQEIRNLATERGYIFVDTATVLLDSTGHTRSALYQADQLHLNDAGYEIWEKLLKQVFAKEAPSTTTLRYPEFEAPPNRM